MRPGPEQQHAELALRLLLAPRDDGRRDLRAVAGVEWDAFLRLAERNVILVRSGDRLQELGVKPSAAFAEAAARERRRVRRAVELIGKITELCVRGGIAFAFIKAFQHYPDMGHDVDLFVLDRTERVDALLTTALGASPEKGSLSHRTAGKASYRIGGYPVDVEVHHGRMGQIGEHTAYPVILMQRRGWTTVGGIETYLPSAEDQMIIQALQRIYDHLTLRLSDVAQTVTALRGGDLDWEYVTETTKNAGIFDGLCCYLAYIDQIHQGLFGRGVAPPALTKTLRQGRWGTVQFRDGYYRFPTASVVGRVYWAKFLAEVRSWNWTAAGRLCLLPPLAILSALGRLGRGPAPRAQRAQVP